MIGLGAHHEHRQPDIGKIDAAPFRQELALRQRVIEVKLAQIFGMHAAWHPRAVGVPGHEIVRLVALAADVVVDGGRPEQVPRPQHGESRPHLFALEHAGAAHGGFQHIELTRADEYRQLARLAEIGLRGEQSDARQTRVALRRERGRRNRQEGPADAIADRVNFPPRDDGRYNFDRRPHAEAQIIVHAKRAIRGRGIFPRHHEHGVALAHQVVDHRIARREIEYVVLHDPRRDDEHRLGEYRGGRRRVLNQLHQLVAHHDLAGSRGHVAPDHEFFRAARSFALERALDVLQPVAETTDEVLTRLVAGRVQEFRVGREIIRRRHGLDRVACHEIQGARRGGAHARHVRPGALPPVRVVLEGMRVDVVRPLRPRIAAESRIARHRLHCLSAGGAQCE